MAKYLMLGKYSAEAIKGIAADRTKKVISLVENNGGKVTSMYALLGSYDLAFVVDFPDHKVALKTSVDIAKSTGIGFSTSPAMTVEEFDNLTS